MLRFLSKQILEGKTYQALEIFEIEGEEWFSFIKTGIKDGEIDMLNSKCSKPIDEIIPLIERKAPLLVTFNTTKVLTKEVKRDVSGDLNSLIFSTFPNLNLVNFYYQIMESEAHSIICISKKEYINNYLEQLKSLKIKPFSISLGAVKIDSLSSFVQGSMQASNFEVDFKNGQLVRFCPLSRTRPSSMIVGDIKLKNVQVLGFSQIIGHLNKKTIRSNLIEINAKLGNNLKNTRLFDFGIKASLISFLVILLCNFIIFNHYYSKNRIMEDSILLDSNSEKALLELKKRVSFKENRLKVLNHSKDSKASFYFDELGKSVPESINLSEMQYQPLNFPVRKDKSIELNERNIQISGITYDKIVFTRWSDYLEIQEWVRSVEIISYEYISKASANFTLNITINEIE